MTLVADLHGATYGTIYADPPWHFQSWSSKGTGRSADRHYGLMDRDAIESLDVGAIAAPDCCLFLWCVDCMLPDALRVMHKWGFQYKTVGFTWVKQTPLGKWHIGHGYWSRSGSEQCLFGTRGKPRPQSHAVRQVVVAKRREHSRKPDEVRNRIRQLSAGPYLELFARESVTGWDSWGLESNKFGAS